jgi:predicted dehydrogenase
MAHGIKVGIIGAGWPGVKHAEGYAAAGGFTVAAVADLIPARRKALLQQCPGAAEHADATGVVNDKSIEAVSVCLPNHLHAAVALAALKAGKHVVCETPPTISAAEAKRLAAAATKARKVLLYAAQRRFGGAEQAATQALAKGYAGDVLHARLSWMRTRGAPAGTGGWYTEKSRSGGGALIDLGSQMIDIGWALLGQPRPVSAYAVVPKRLHDAALSDRTFDVEDCAFVLLKFEGGKSMELAVSWAVNQPPRQQGTACRVHGDKGAVEVYTPQGPLLYRNFGPKGEAKETPLKLPKVVLYPAMMRHFKQCIQGAARALVGPAEGLMLMQTIEAIYRSAQTGKSVEIKGAGDLSRSPLTPALSRGGEREEAPLPFSAAQFSRAKGPHAGAEGEGDIRQAVGGGDGDVDPDR